MEISVAINDALDTVTGAIENLARRQNVPSAWRTAEWAKAPLDIVNRSFFSAGVESSRWLDAGRSRLDQAAASATGPDGRMSRETFIRDMRQITLDLGLGSPDQPANVQNLAGATRLGMVWDMNLDSAHGRARRAAGLSRGALFSAPAQELVRGRSARVPRDWFSRWNEAGTAVSWEGARQCGFPGDRMVALKTSLIWEELSDFGVPWPPFAFGSGMILRNVRRDDAIELGLIEEDQILDAPADPDFNSDLDASMANVAADIVQNVLKLFGNRVAFKDGILSWIGN